MSDISIDRLSYTLGVDDSVYDFEGRCQVYEDNVESNTIVSCIEHCLATDFSSYYDDWDREHGLEFNSNFKTVHLKGSGIDIKYNGSISVGELPNNLRCIRYAGGKSIRDFRVSNGFVPSKNLISKHSRDLLKYLKFAEDINKIFGKEIVSLDTSDKLYIGFNIDYSLVDCNSFDAVYLTLHQIYLSSDKFILLFTGLSLNSTYLVRFMDFLEKQCNIVTSILVVK